MFSKVEEERLYSTGNNELDDLLERAFCDGYEYAQREFNSSASKQANNKFFEKVGKKYQSNPKNFINKGETTKVSGRLFLNDESFRNSKIDELARRQADKAQASFIESNMGLPKGTGDKIYQNYLKKSLKEKHGKSKIIGKYAKDVLRKIK